MAVSTNNLAASMRSILLTRFTVFLLMIYTIDNVPFRLKRQPTIRAYSTSENSVILVTLYVLYLFFRHKAHAQLYDDND